VRREVARLAGEVHRRDLALGTLRGSASDADRHLSDATRRADRREAELTVDETAADWPLDVSI